MWTETLRRALAHDTHSIDLFDEEEIVNQIISAQEVVNSFSGIQKRRLLKYLNSLSRDDIHLVDWDTLGFTSGLYT